MLRPKNLTLLLERLMPVELSNSCTIASLPLISMPVREQIGRFKYTKEEDLDVEYAKVSEELHIEIANSMKKEEF